MAYVDLEDMPSAKKEYTLSFPQLKGGLNTELLDYQLDSNESPNMRNLKWRDGVLGSRYGQVWDCVDESGNAIELGRSYSAYERLWYGRMVIHAGTKLYCFDPKGKSLITAYDGVPEVRGTFFAYGEELYYKTRGAYYKIELSNSLEPEITSLQTFKTQYPYDGYYTFTYNGIYCAFDVDETIPVSATESRERQTTIDGTISSTVLRIAGITMNRPSVGDTLTVTKTTESYVTTITIVSQSSGLNASVYSQDVFIEKYPNDGTYVFECTASYQKLRCCSINALGTNYSDVATTESGNYLTFYGVKIKQPAEDDAVRVYASGKNVEIMQLNLDVTDMSVSAYVPITYINASPSSGAGDEYQPENRLSAKKTIWYNAEQNVTVTASTGLTAEIVPVTFLVKVPASGTYTFSYNGTSWIFGGEEVVLSDYGLSCSGTPSSGSTITVTSIAVKDYYLPVKATSVRDVTVDGVSKTEDLYDIQHSSTIDVDIDKYVFTTTVAASTYLGFSYTSGSWYCGGTAYTAETLKSTYGITVTGTPVDGNSITVDFTTKDYSYYPDKGLVRFRTAPPVTVPATNNTVYITYVLENSTAYNNIMDCRYATTYGGTGSLCIVMAGSLTQPNAYFWNGQTSTSVDPSYFPMEQYQLAGDVVDPIVAFGKQQSYLIIFKEHSIGRSSADTTEINDRTYIDLPYTAINTKVGCDIPWSIQLVENNLTWCNTEQGVCFLANTSAAYENNVIRISDKVNSGSAHSGVLYDLRKDSAETICSVDDEHKYVVCANGHCWLWDYEISTYKDPVWFYYTDINANSFIHEVDETWHVDESGRITYFENNYSDYGKGIDKLYEFAVQNFGSYDCLKNINSVIFVLRPDSESTVKLQYVTDYENRYDLTDLETNVWKLSPRNLAERNMRGSGFAGVLKRKPHCRRVRHFAMILSNNTAGEDLAIASAQIFYTFQGRQR